MDPPPPGPPLRVQQAMQALLGEGAYYSWLQSGLIQAQYFKDPFHLDWYLAYSGFLADVNNDRPATNASYAEALRSLQRLVLFQFENDITVVPRQSAHFGFYNGSIVVRRQFFDEGGCDGAAATGCAHRAAVP